MACVTADTAVHQKQVQITVEDKCQDNKTPPSSKIAGIPLQLKSWTGLSRCVFVFVLQKIDGDKVGCLLALLITHNTNFSFLMGA